MRKYKILIVEDEVLVRGGLKAMIDWEKLGLELAGMLRRSGGLGNI